MARITKARVNQELSSRGIDARLGKADTYFYFTGPAVLSWWDRTVQVARVNDLSLVGGCERTGTWSGRTGTAAAREEIADTSRCVHRAQTEAALS